MTLEEELASLKSDLSARWSTVGEERARSLSSSQAQYEAIVYLANSIRIAALQVALALDKRRTYTRWGER